MVYVQVAFEDTGTGADAVLLSADRESGDFVVAGVLQGLAMVLIVPVLLYLFRASRYRREQTMPAAAVLAVLGGVTLAVATVLQKLEIIDIAHGFFPEAANAAKDVEDAAEDEIRDNVSAGLQVLGLAGAAALAFSVIVICLNSMRSGLLSRFMGVLGILFAVFLIVPLFPIPVTQIFWLCALGALFLGRWPGGRGPAWATGEAIPWPGAAEQREEIERRRAEREGIAPPAAEPEPEPESDRPVSRKRKKKRR